MINSSVTVDGEAPFIDAVAVALSPRQLPERRQLVQDSARGPWQHDARPLGTSSPAQ